MKRGFLMVVFLFALGNIYSQHVIEDVSFNIEGKTQESYLKKYIKVSKGQFFDSAEDLVEYLDFRTQFVINLHNTEEVSYEITNVKENDYLTLYTIEFYVRDGWSLVPLAYPVISNNSIAPHIYISDYNFLGTLNRVTLFGFFDYRLLENSDHPDNETWGFGEWQVELELEKSMIMGFLTDITLTQDYMEVQSINKDQSFDQNYSKYMTSLDLELEQQINQDWVYSFGPKLVASYGFTKYPEEGDVCDSEVLLASYEHGLTWGNLNWVGNFKEGHSVELSNSLGWALFDPSVNEDEVLFTPDFTLEAIKYLLLGDRLNYNSRGWLYYGINHQYLEIDEMRGVQAQECFAYSAAILNNGVNISLINNEIFEIQLEPFFDGGIFFTESDFFSGDYTTKLSTGFEITYYMHSVKGFYIWSNGGVDLTNWGQENMINFKVFGEMIF